MVNTRKSGDSLWESALSSSHMGWKEPRSSVKAERSFTHLRFIGLIRISYKIYNFITLENVLFMTVYVREWGCHAPVWGSEDILWS